MDSIRFRLVSSYRMNESERRELYSLFVLIVLRCGVVLYIEHLFPSKQTKINRNLTTLLYFAFLFLLRYPKLTTASFSFLSFFSSRPPSLSHSFTRFSRNVDRCSH